MPYRSLWRRVLVVLAVISLGCGPSQAHDAAPHPGIDVLHYTFRLTLSDASDRVQGEATVRLRVESDTLTAARLDLIGVDGGTGMRVTSVTEDGAPVTFSQSNNHVHVALDDAAVGAEHTFVVAYEGIPADGLIIGENQHGDRTFFGDNWPNRARHWLPVVDHLADKATVEFRVTAPAHYQVVSNGTLVSRTTAGETRTTHWRTDVPLPPKVVIVGVADTRPELPVQTLGPCFRRIEIHRISRGPVCRREPRVHGAVDPLIIALPGRVRENVGRVERPHFPHHVDDLPGVNPMKCGLARIQWSNTFQLREGRRIRLGSTIAPA